MSSTSSSPVPVSRPSKLHRYFGGGLNEPEVKLASYDTEREINVPSDGLAVNFKHDLHRGLNSRQIAMVPHILSLLSLCR
jgi:hypothetical protein